MSEIKVNSIKGVGSTDAAITINNTDGTCTANITNRTNKNLVVNGAFLISQRGTSSTSSGYQTVDRFAVDFSGTDEAPTQAQVDVTTTTTPYTLGFRKAVKITNGNQTSGAGASDYVRIRHIFEAQDIANSGWNFVSSSSYITLSFWVKSSISQNFYGFIRNSEGTMYQYPFETGSLTANTWTKVTKTISGNANLTLNNDNAAGLELYIHAFSGTGETASGVGLNAWSTYSGSAKMPDFTSTWYTTNDATFEITGVQLEVSDHATDFEHRSFADELARCQRYFQKIACNEMMMTLIRTSDNQHRLVLNHPVTMRATPTGTITSSSQDGGGSLTIPTLSKDAIVFRQGSTGTGNTPSISEYTLAAEL